MPNHTWTDEAGVEWMRVDIPRGAHGNLLAGIREDPECMNEDEYGPDWNHSYCGGSDSDEVLASEFTYDKYGLQSTFRQELRSKASHDYRVMQFPAYFTADEVEAAYNATGRRQPDPIGMRENPEGSRYVTFPIHTSRRQGVLGDIQRVSQEEYMHSLLESYNNMRRNIVMGSTPQVYDPDVPLEPMGQSLTPEQLASLDEQEAELREHLAAHQRTLNEQMTRNIETTYGLDRGMFQLQANASAALRLYQAADWSWVNDPPTRITPEDNPPTDEQFPMPTPTDDEVVIDFTIPPLERRQTHYQVNNDTDFTEGMPD